MSDIRPISKPLNLQNSYGAPHKPCSKNISGFPDAHADAHADAHTPTRTFRRYYVYAYES